MWHSKGLLAPFMIHGREDVAWRTFEKSLASSFQTDESGGVQGEISGDLSGFGSLARPSGEL